LCRDPDRERALLGKRRVIDDQHRILAADERGGLLGQHAPQWRIVPGGTADEVVQLIVTAKPETGGDRLYALRTIWPQ
jgi:hypothetical protein